MVPKRNHPSPQKETFEAENGFQKDRRNNIVENYSKSKVENKGESDDSLHANATDSTLLSNDNGKTENNETENNNSNSNNISFDNNEAVENIKLYLEHYVPDVYNYFSNVNDLQEDILSCINKKIKKTKESKEDEIKKIEVMFINLNKFKFTTNNGSKMSAIDWINKYGKDNTFEKLFNTVYKHFDNNYNWRDYYTEEINANSSEIIEREDEYFKKQINKYMLNYYKCIFGLYDKLPSYDSGIKFNKEYIKKHYTDIPTEEFNLVKDYLTGLINIWNKIKNNLENYRNIIPEYYYNNNNYISLNLFLNYDEYDGCYEKNKLWEKFNNNLFEMNEKIEKILDSNERYRWNSDIA